MINRDDIPETFGNILKFGFFGSIALYGEELEEFENKFNLKLGTLNSILNDEKEIDEKEDEIFCKIFSKEKGFFLELQEECKKRLGEQTKEISAKETEILDLTQ